MTYETQQMHTRMVDKHSRVNQRTNERSQTRIPIVMRDNNNQCIAYDRGTTDDRIPIVTNQNDDAY
jgi:hypothetical protein